AREGARPEPDAPPLGAEETRGRAGTDLKLSLKRRTVMPRKLEAAVLAGLLALVPGGPLRASSHMDAPLIVLDDAANTTDVYAFVTGEDGRKYLTTALAVYPHEEPGIGPNKYNFDDNVLYEIHVALGRDL